jgi:hypothetical protein
MLRHPILCHCHVDDGGHIIGLIAESNPDKATTVLKFFTLSIRALTLAIEEFIGHKIH